jgi:hypothetical protein
VLENHYKFVQWFYLAYNVTTEVSPSMWVSHSLRSPILCHMGSSHHRCTHTTPRFNHRSFTEHPSGSVIAASPYNRLVRKDYTLSHTMSGHTHIGSWLYCIHMWSLNESVLKFRYDNKPQAFSIAPDKSLEPLASHRQVSNPITSNPILHTSRIQIIIIVTEWPKHKWYNHNHYLNPDQDILG